MIGGTSIGSLVLELAADGTAYLRVLNDVESRTRSSTDMVLKMFKYTSIGIVSALAAISVAAVREFGKFEDAMTKSLAIMEGVSKQTRREMEEVARAIGRSTTTTATEAAQAYLFLASAGLSAAQSMKALPQVQKFAQAAAIDMARATDMLTSSQAGLGMVSKDAAQNLVNLTRITDVLTQAANISNGSAEEFATSLKTKVAASARLVGKDIEEVVAVLGVYADQGIKAEDAGEKLSQAMRDLQVSTINNKDVWKQFNLEVFDSAGKMLPLVKIIEQLEGVTKDLSDEQKRTMFTLLGFQDRSVSAVMALMGTTEKIKEYEASLRSAGGATETVAKKQMESFNAELKILMNRLQDVLIAVGAELIPLLKTLTAVLDEVTGSQEKMTATSTMLADVIKTGVVVGLMVLADTAYGIKGIFIAIQILWEELGKTFQYMIQVWNVAILAFSTLIEGVFRGWQKLFLLTWAVIKNAFVEALIFMGNRMIEMAIKWNQLMPKSLRIDTEDWKRDLGVLHNQLNVIRKDYDDAMAKTTNVSLSALKQQTAEFQAYRKAVNEGTTEFDKRVDALALALVELGESGRPSEKILETFNKITMEFNAMRENAKAAGAATKTALEDTNKAGTNVAETLTRLARLKAEAEDPFEGAMFNLIKFDQLLREKIISLDEYNLARKRTLESTSPFMSMDSGIQGMDELDALQQKTKDMELQYKVQKDIAIKYGKMTKDELERMERMYLIKQANFRNQEKIILIQSSQSVADSLLSISENLAGKQSGIYKAMFAVSKAFAIAEAIMSIQLAIAQAAKAEPWYMKIPAMATIAAATAGIVANIQSVGMSFEGGGMMPNRARTGGLDGRGGMMALVHPNEGIVDFERGQGMGGGVQVNIFNNAPGVEVEQERSEDGKSLDVIIKRATESVANDIRRGGGPVSNALETAYPVRRGQR